MPLVYPHEFIARTAIHSVKAGLAKELKNLGISQKDIAKLMNSQVSTISQYVNGQRGGSYELSENVMNLLSAVAEAIDEEPTEELLKYGVSQICNKIIEEEYGYNFDEEEKNKNQEIEETQYGSDIDLSD